MATAFAYFWHDKSKFAIGVETKVSRPFGQTLKSLSFEMTKIIAFWPKPKKIKPIKPTQNYPAGHACKIHKS